MRTISLLSYNSIPSLKGDNSEPDSPTAGELGEKEGDMEDEAATKLKNVVVSFMLGEEQSRCQDFYWVKPFFSIETQRFHHFLHQQDSFGSFSFPDDDSSANGRGNEVCLFPLFL